LKIQINSNKTVAVGVGLTRFVEREVSRALGRFEPKVTRVEVHLSDVDGKKSGQADKRCLIEARPRLAQPVSVSAKAADVGLAVGQALDKMQRALTKHFVQKASKRPARVSPEKNAAVKKPAAAAKKGIGRASGAS
jgi:ribosome-associated translation inhibitor RaiA